MFLDEFVHSAPPRENYVVLGVVRLTGVGTVICCSDCPKGTRGTHPAIVSGISPIYHLRTVVLRRLLGSEADDTEVVPPAVDNVAPVSDLLSRFPDLSIEATFYYLPRSFETLN
tara:strand:+ start:49 stop:390 length:342 start_codon:yes stop_codon:yes gene_type:complete